MTQTVTVNSPAKLNNIQQQVDAIVQASHQQVVMSVYQWMLNRHNDIKCGCDYCLQLRGYTLARRDLHRFKKFLEYDPGYDFYNFKRDSEEYERLKRRVASLKEQKDKLKII